jgi:hypothetical protein
MSKKHQRLIEAIFSSHPGNNIHWQEVESLLLHIGATFSSSHGSRLLITLEGRELTLHRPHHGAAVGKGDLHQLREFLRAAGYP